MKKFLLVFFIYFSSCINAQVTFSYTGAVQTYTVPPAVFSLLIDANGAAGGRSIGTTPGPHDPGLGGRVQTTLAVNPGDIINIYVGEVGLDGVPGGSATGGWNGGGAGNGAFVSYGGGSGGGASDIRIGGTALANRVIIAAGGGGSGFNYLSGGDHGGHGGGLVGDNGHSGGGLPDPPGEGGTQITGGTGGLWVGYLAGTDGILGLGGNAGGDGAGGGGGGGYYGGGGGSWAGGGGGSSYVDAVLTSSTTHTIGANSGNGFITITPISSLPVELLSFTAKQKDERIELQWSTASERDNAFFIVEKLNVSSQKWELLLKQNGAGNSNSKINYLDWDLSPSLGDNFYRIKQVDFNGASKISDVISVNYSIISDLVLYPNPCSDLFFVYGEGITIDDLSIYDVYGFKLENNYTLTKLSNQRIQVNVESLVSGQYLLKSNGKIIRFVVIH